MSEFRRGVVPVQADSSHRQHARKAAPCHGPQVHRGRWRADLSSSTGGEWCEGLKLVVCLTQKTNHSDYWHVKLLLIIRRTLLNQMWVLIFMRWAREVFARVTYWDGVWLVINSILLHLFLFWLNTVTTRETLLSVSSATCDQTWFHLPHLFPLFSDGFCRSLRFTPGTGKCPCAGGKWRISNWSCRETHF